MNNSSGYLSELHCPKDALTNNYGWFMQFLLAVLAFTCLIGKRFCEPRYARRPWLIWFYDTSKQGLGALLIHAANVWLSPHFTGNTCTWYIVNFMMDSTLGLLIIWAGIRLAQYYARTYDIPLINFGEYGKPPMCSAWICQCILYAALATFAKSVLALVLRLPIVVEVLSTLRLSPVTDARLELAVVLLIIPFFVNVSSIKLNYILCSCDRSDIATACDVRQVSTGAGSAAADSRGSPLHAATVAVVIGAILQPLATFAKSVLALVLRLPIVVEVLSTLRLSPVTDARLELAVVLLIIPFFVNSVLALVLRLPIVVEVLSTLRLSPVTDARLELAVVLLIIPFFVNVVVIGAILQPLATFAKSVLALVLRLPIVVEVLSTLRLSPVTDARLELAVVLLIIPFFVNILIFWVTDNFLMYHPRGVNSKIKTKVRYQSIKKEKSGSDEEEHSADERLLGSSV
ncbi:store-operated calcium entry regulator STIMATE-like [Ostrinia nubilalis]|uniref:store-operated calcium entry regulator STIMATE-like n=1 Tax=Ostrinia nubilalis TaxID=29057 RepID=UPI0030824060